MSYQTAIILVVLPLLSQTGLAESKFPKLEKCYQAFGQLEETSQSGKKVTVYKTQAEVAAECNRTVVAEAKKSKTKEAVIELAGVIGRNSNWAQAMPIYVSGAKKFKANICKDNDAIYALDAALEHPGTDDSVKHAKEFLAACWPVCKEIVIGMLKPESSSYVKPTLCNFLKSKKALPKDKIEICQ